jgi:aminoglycoside phosphotransferase (APT) family kinase protein
VSDSLITGLRALLRERWHDPDADVLAVDPFGDGHSGFTYLVDLRTATAGGRYVMRLSPPGARIAANADVGRQGRIMAALHAAGVPTPAVLFADSGGVLDGRSIMITERVSGVDCKTAVAEHGADWVVDAATSALHQVHAVPVDAVGLPGEQPTSAAGDVARWSRLLDRAPEELHADGYRLRDALLDALPAPVPPALVHGDYHYGNLLFGPDGVAAVLDWEIAGLGDPRWDFGSLAVTVIRRKYNPEPNVTGDLDVSLADLARRFAATPDLAWFAAAACFKYTAILGYNRGLHLKGRRPDPVYDQLVGTIGGLAADGLTMLADGVTS